MFEQSVLSLAVGIRGPHPIPKPRQVQHTFSRIFSVKAGMRIVEVESRLEADALYMAEGNPDVVALCEQPMRIPLPVKNQPYITLDLGTTLTNGREILYEIKPESKLSLQPDGRRLPPNWPLIERWCEQHGFGCQVMTDTEIGKNAMLIRNWRILLPFVRLAKEQPNPTLTEKILATVEAHGVLRFGEITEYIPRTQSQELYSAQALLLHQGYLSGALKTEPFTLHTKISGADDASAT